jgi:metalloendopeptidase OMA1, mitochondrial
MLHWPPSFAAVALVLWLAAGCATVSETGRKQVMLVTGEQETQLGLTSFDKLKKEQPISKDAAANALVQKVGKCISAVAQLPNAQWEFVASESKEANSYSTQSSTPQTANVDGVGPVVCRTLSAL